MGKPKSYKWGYGESFSYIYPWPFWLSYCQRSENSRSYLPTRLGHAQNPCNMFHNPLPRFDVPSYSIHVDHGAHVTFHSDAIARQLIISAPNANDTPDALKSPWQKVTASRAHHPPINFFIFFIYPIMKVPHLRYDMLKWTYWKSASPESQRSVRVWNTMRNLWHFRLQF